MNPAFETLERGPFGPDRILARFVDRPRPTSSALESVIDAEWKLQVRIAQQSGRTLFNGAMLRLIEYRVSDPEGTLSLTVGPTCFRDFVGTNLFHADRVGDFSWQSFANPVGTSAIIVSEDRRLVVARRSDSVLFDSGKVHLFGGTLDDADKTDSDLISVFDSIHREIREELAIVDDEILESRCLGMLRDRRTLQPELVFETRVSLSSHEINNRWTTAPDRDEHNELLTLDAEAESIRRFIQSERMIAPVAVGALELVCELAIRD